MLVTRVLGPCPKCAYPRYGNVLVARDHVLRGCERCEYSTQFLLPEIRKKILYVDQAFFSGAFRKGDRRFIELADRLRSVSAAQLLAIPRSSVHEAETRLWSRAEDLWSFIKQTSRGHEFEPDYAIERAQILQAFRQWLAGEPSRHCIDPADGVPTEIHHWDGYFSIDVKRALEGSHDERLARKKSTENLIALFDGWKKSEHSFEEHVSRELDGARKQYLDAFLKKIWRVGHGDFAAMFDSPVTAEIVEQMLHYFAKDDANGLERCDQFFRTEHFAAVPCKFIECAAYAVLREQVKSGAYANPRKAVARLGGFYSDVAHVSHYGPYCDAILVDQAMARLLKHPKLAIQERFGVSVFSLTNLTELYDWLGALESSMSAEHRAGLRVAYS